MRAYRVTQIVKETTLVHVADYMLDSEDLEDFILDCAAEQRWDSVIKETDIVEVVG